ncbi:uncharacterized protein LOC144121766 isoform X2 [Amblyomma americanum]
MSAATFAWWSKQVPPARAYRSCRSYLRLHHACTLQNQHAETRSSMASAVHRRHQNPACCSGKKLVAWPIQSSLLRAMASMSLSGTEELVVNVLQPDREVLIHLEVLEHCQDIEGPFKRCRSSSIDWARNLPRCWALWHRWGQPHPMRRRCATPHPHPASFQEANHHFLYCQCLLRSRVHSAPSDLMQMKDTELIVCKQSTK